MKMSKISNRILWIIISLSTSLFIAHRCEGEHFRSDTVLSRVKRQDRKRESEPINWDLVDETLYGWTPQGSTTCRQGQYLCRDESYCFPSNSLCNKLVSCNDQSDEVNSLCGYTTTSTPSAKTSTTTRPKDRTDKGGPQDVYNRFNDPLVISFLVFIIGMAVYVAVATVVCIKTRFNVIQPGVDSFTRSRGIGNESNSDGKIRTQAKEATSDRVFVENGGSKNVNIST